MLAGCVYVSTYITLLALAPLKSGSDLHFCPIMYTFKAVWYKSHTLKCPVGPFWTPIVLVRRRNYRSLRTVNCDPMGRH